MSRGWSFEQQSNIDTRRGKKNGKRKLAYKKKKRNNLLIAVIVVMILVYCGYMGYRGYLLKQTKATLEQEISVLNDGIETETNRVKELEQFEVYTHTKKYAEEFAKDALSYVYPDEIIFKPE